MQFSARCRVQFTTVHTDIQQFTHHCSTMNTTMNLTGNEDQSKSLLHLFCFPGEFTEIHNWLTCLIALNIVLSITAFLENTLILVALRKESSLHPPIKLLFRCLATTDLFAGLISEPLYVIYLTSAMKESWIFCHYTSLLSFLVGSILGSVSLLTVTTISVDRLLALLLGLRYRHVVTLRRTYVAVTVLWIVVVATAMYFWNERVSLWFGYISISVCLVISILSYTKIFHTLRHNRTQVQNHVYQEQHSQAGTLNIARYRKAVSSALLVQLALVLCYLPYVIAGILMTESELSLTLYIVRQLTATLLFLNSSLNPILYCWKITEVRQAVKDTIKRLRCTVCSAF